MPAPNVRRPSLRLLALGLAALLGSSTLAAAAEVTVQDSRGKDIAISSSVKSVAIFPLPIPEVLIAIDQGTGRLTAINPRAKAALMNGAAMSLCWARSSARKTVPTHFSTGKTRPWPTSLPC